MALLSAVGCATIVSGSSRDIQFAVNPPGTSVCIEGEVVGQTPFTFRGGNQSGYSVLLAKPGYRSATVAITRAVNPWIVGNVVPLVIFPGPIGLLIDISTGAVHKYEPDRVSFSLEPDTTSGPRAAAADSARCVR